MLVILRVCNVTLEQILRFYFLKTNVWHSFKYFHFIFVPVRHYFQQFITKGSNSSLEKQDLRLYPQTIGASIASSPIFNWYE